MARLKLTKCGKVVKPEIIRPNENSIFQLFVYENKPFIVKMRILMKLANN